MLRKRLHLDLPLVFHSELIFVFYLFHFLNLNLLVEHNDTYIIFHTYICEAAQHFTLRLCLEKINYIQILPLHRQTISVDAHPSLRFYHLGFLLWNNARKLYH